MSLATSTLRDAQLRKWSADLDRGAAARSSALRCGDCRHVIPDTINPPAGMGGCAREQGSWHPMAPHHCRTHRPRGIA